MERKRKNNRKFQKKKNIRWKECKWIAKFRKRMSGTSGYGQNINDLVRNQKIFI